MTQISPAAEDLDIARLDAWALCPSHHLRFPADLERRYLVHNLPARARNTHIAGWFGVLVYNILFSLNLIRGLVPPDAAASALIVVHGCMTLPCLTIIFLAPYVRGPRTLDIALLCSYALVTIASVHTSFQIGGDHGVYDAFTMVLIPVAYNIAVPISFAFAAIGSTFCVFALTLTTFVHPGFSSDARTVMILLYVMAAAITLVANHRHETGSRLHYLNYLRETLRNAHIQRANALLAMVSRTDFLTGLANRRDFDERFLADLTRCERDRLPLTVLIADIDHFKKLNDQHGHIEGDACLKSVARAIGEAIEGTGGFAARYGGEEFAVVLPGMSHLEAAAVAERVQSTVRALRIVNRGLGDQRCVSISVGAASWDNYHPEAPSDLLARADSALYRAKRGGRDRTEVDLRADAA